jgi:NTE family protein
MGMTKIRSLFGKRPQTAFVLGGGGNLGSIQVGQLRALMERGIKPDVVIGCSVGALNGAAVASEPTIEGATKLAEFWRGLTREDIFPSTKMGRGPWLFMRNGTSAYSDSGLRNVIKRWNHIDRFEETTVPFWVVATALRSGVERWFHSGQLAPALLASTSLPGIFPPVDIDGDTYIDGGVVNNVPISKAIDLGCKRIYVLDVGNLEKERPAAKRPYEVLMQAVSIARAHRYRYDRDHIPEGTQMIRLPAVDVGKLRYDDFNRTPELIERAYRATATFLGAVTTPAVIAQSA